jgi:hypothetical protein
MVYTDQPMEFPMMSKHEISRPYRTLGLSSLLSLFAVFALWPHAVAWAHGVSAADQDAMLAGSAFDFVGLGAVHMLTGYDHLLFLFGVIFFLASFRDVVRFISAFTLGHCITLLGATLAGVQANAYLIDAVIAVSVIYKGFENLDGFKRYFDRKSPDLLLMVFIFGLIHGFGLSTRLQEINLGEEGLITRILSFNVGVEVGQIAALSIMILVFSVWRKSATFVQWSTRANQALVLAGVALFAVQMNGYFNESASEHHDDDHHVEMVDSHDHHAKEAVEVAPTLEEKTLDTTPEVIAEEVEEAVKEASHHHKPAQEPKAKHGHSHGSEHSH